MLLLLADVQDRAEVEGALTADDRDILSAYSSEQGAHHSSILSFIASGIESAVQDLQKTAVHSLKCAALT